MMLIILYVFNSLWRGNRFKCDNEIVLITKCTQKHHHDTRNALHTVCSTIVYKYTVYLSTLYESSPHLSKHHAHQVCTIAAAATLENHFIKYYYLSRIVSVAVALFESNCHLSPKNGRKKTIPGESILLLLLGVFFFAISARDLTRFHHPFDCCRKISIARIALHHVGY